MKIMDVVNDFNELKACMQEAEEAYDAAIQENGEPTYVGFDGDDMQNMKHKFMPDEIKTLAEWIDSICLGVLNEYAKNPNAFGCYEIASGLSCLECGCRNYSLAAFLFEAFEDARQFITYLNKMGEEL